MHFRDKVMSEIKSRLFRFALLFSTFVLTFLIALLVNSWVLVSMSAFVFLVMFFDMEHSKKKIDGILGGLNEINGHSE